MPEKTRQTLRSSYTNTSQKPDSDPGSEHSVKIRNEPETAAHDCTAKIQNEPENLRPAAGRGFNQQVTMDGVSIARARVNMVAFKPSIDAMEEFKVQTGSCSAESGRQSGAQIQIAMKSRYSGVPD